MGKRKVQSNYTKDVCFSEDTRAKDNVGGVLDLPKKKTFPAVSGRLLEKLLLTIWSLPSDAGIRATAHP